MKFLGTNHLPPAVVPDGGRNALGVYRSLLATARRWAVRACYYSGLLQALLLLRRGKSSGLLILMYHSIGASTWLRPGLCVSERTFARQLRYLTRHFQILSLERAVEMMRRGEPLPNNAVALTFDDGYRDNFEKAFPILKKYGCPATLFVATEPLETTSLLWPNKLFVWFKATKSTRLQLRLGKDPAESKVFDLRTERQRRTALNTIEALLCCLEPPERDRLLREIAERLGFAPNADLLDYVPMLTWNQLREMAEAGISIGSHTMTHPVLSTLDRDDALRELAESKALLEKNLKRPVAFFAYPFGVLQHFNAETQALAEKAGYRAACSAIRGLNHPDTNRFALLRVGVQDDPPAVLAFKLLRFI